jgi:hypothetical protein
VFRVDDEDLPVADLPSFVWCGPVSGVEEIQRDWRREMDALGFACPPLPAETARKVLDTLEDCGLARLTFLS